MFSHYKHSQYSWWTVLVSLFLMGLVVYLYITHLWSGALALALGIAVFGILILLLSYRLKVEVDDSHIHLAYGIGLIHRSITRADVTGAEAVHNSFWYGWASGGPHTAGCGTSPGWTLWKSHTQAARSSALGLTTQSS